jgi:hypothetical protein
MVQIIASNDRIYIGKNVEVGAKQFKILFWYTPGGLSKTTKILSQGSLQAECVVLRQSHVTTTWHFLKLQMDETASRYTGYVYNTCRVAANI